MTIALAGAHQPTVVVKAIASDREMRPAVGASRPPAVASPPAPMSPHERSSALNTVAPVTERSSEPEDDAVIAVPPTVEDVAVPAFDEAAEAAFLGEARERGEVVRPKSPAEVEETNPKALPRLDELVEKIPPNVREVLEDLFRARFVTVKRFPKKALKSNQPAG